MKGEEKEPTPSELQAMAYVDGELALAERKSFEERMRRDRSLAMEVAALERLAVLARNAADPEPMDFEWEELARSGVRRAGLSIGWTLLVGGAIALAFAAGWWIAESELPLAAKLGVAAVVAGFSILFVLTLRARVCTLPFDAYTDIKR